MSLEYVDDLTPAKWIAERLHPFAQDAGAIIPPGFEAYARIFHPATRQVGQLAVPVTWREIADANLRVHPRTGTLSLEIARSLVDILRGHTTTPDLCWFAAWEGWGDYRDGSAVLITIGGSPDNVPATPPPGTYREKPSGRPTFALPHRGYYLARGPLAAALETVYGVTWAYLSASIWWPEDRAWCVATEVDFDWTYVGGSAECIAAILRSPDLEALPARTSDGVTYDSDRLNPRPPL
jgi:hypothetical protein